MPATAKKTRKAKPYDPTNCTFRDWCKHEEEGPFPGDPDDLAKEAGGRYRPGCKVHWWTLATREDAERVAVAARAHARFRYAAGYDAGYLSPGCVEQVSDGFEVCIL